MLRQVFPFNNVVLIIYSTPLYKDEKTDGLHFILQISMSVRRKEQAVTVSKHV